MDFFFQINKHVRHFFYLQFPVHVFQIYVLIFVKYTLLFILGAGFFVCLIDVLGAQ